MDLRLALQANVFRLIWTGALFTYFSFITYLFIYLFVHFIFYLFYFIFHFIWFSFFLAGGGMIFLFCVCSYYLKIHVCVSLIICVTFLKKIWGALSTEQLSTQGLRCETWFNMRIQSIFHLYKSGSHTRECCHHCGEIQSFCSSLCQFLKGEANHTLWYWTSCYTTAQS